MNITMQKTATGVALGLAALWLTVGAARVEAAIYQDNMEGNDYGLRYAENSNGPEAYAVWPAGSGNHALRWDSGAVSAIHTTDYLNGGFTDTAYSVTCQVWNNSPVLGQQLRLTLLNNGYVASANVYAGYQVIAYPNGATALLLINRMNTDGTNVSLAEVSYPAQRSGYWENITASVVAGASSTVVSLTWAGLATDGTTPVSYTVTATDAAAGRFTSGHGLGLIGYAGDQPSPGVYLDNLVVAAVPEPGTMVLAALGAVGALLRRRGSRRIRS